ncbi:hypothetical protein BVU17_09450 [Haloarcula taiwanensis]|uniref:Uncharacterized protein n=1 Tax=Haloarcula taiwanensis TaxID=1932004 RepID=A0A2H4ZZ21_9EURY|nr:MULTISPECIES: hypothetical protein [Haloarcula]AUG47729.1 hypothetical protein BVU17_09450 [Haloarcula taiwanensis]RLM39034.1 hypothetical protein DVK01_00305 [Haloarcula sp. Atlit-120R]RLM46980.1 hypothetical protein DVK00_00305 [Haloarcula sp. Atlit-47R]
MPRNQTRRRTLALLGSALSVPVAGCSGGLFGSETDTAPDTPTPTPEPTVQRVPAAYRLRRWLPPLWTLPYSNPAQVGYQTVNVSDLRFARLDASAGNELIADAASDARTEDSIPLAMTYRTEALEVVVIARGPTEALLDSFEARGMTEGSSDAGYRVYYQTDEEGERRLTYIGGNEWSVYVRFSGDRDEDLTAALLEARTGEGQSWASASPETRPLFYDAYVAADAQGVLFPSPTPGSFEGVDGDLHGALASTVFPGSDEQSYDTARMQVTLAFAPNAPARRSAVEAVYRGAAESAERETFRLSYWPVFDDPTVEQVGESAIRVRQDVDTETLRDA